MNKPLKKFVKTHAKKVPPWTKPTYMSLVACLVIIFGWKIVRPAPFWLQNIPVLNNFVFHGGGTYFCLALGWLGMFLVWWKVSLPLFCRCLQVWFPEDFDAYKVETDTLAETN